MTEPTPALNAAIAELQTQLPRIAKDKTAKIESQRTGKTHTYKFADLADVTEEILPLLGKLGLSFVSRPTMVGGEFGLLYELRHSSGELIDGFFPMPRTGGPQDMGSWITYVRRYCLCSVTGLAPDADDDAAGAQAASQRPPRERAAKSEPGVTAEQQRQMNALFRETPMESKEERLAYVAEKIEREIDSATELTRSEAGKVINRLEAYIADNQPPASTA